ncbi:MAG: amidohydrolase family protein [candidate division KSB1 bacterium]|nr:amidohydrolase family protein [candidate division KSB1 bacterium]
MMLSILSFLLWPNHQTQLVMPFQEKNEQPTTSGLWQAYRLIDIHAHIGSYRGYDLRTETLLSNIGRYGIRLALISNIDGANLPGTTLNLNEIEANQATLETVRRYPQQLRGLLWARPEDGSPANLETFLQDTSLADANGPLWVGIKLHPEMNHFPADDPRVDGYLRLCEQYRLPAVFHSDRAGSNAAPEKIYAAARRYPAVPIILYHMGFKGPHEAAIAVVKTALAKGDAQLYLETSQADPQAVIRAIKELGSERVLFGTDATYYGEDHYANYETLVNWLKNELPAEDFANVVRENAEKLFRLRP